MRSDPDGEAATPVPLRTRTDIDRLAASFGIFRRPDVLHVASDGRRAARLLERLVPVCGCVPTAVAVAGTLAALLVWGRGPFTPALAAGWLGAVLLAGIAAKLGTLLLSYALARIVLFALRRAVADEAGVAP